MDMPGRHSGSISRESSLAKADYICFSPTEVSFSADDPFTADSAVGYFALSYGSASGRLGGVTDMTKREIFECLTSSVVEVWVVVVSVL